MMNNRLIQRTARAAAGAGVPAASAVATIVELVVHVVYKYIKPSGYDDAASLPSRSDASVLRMTSLSVCRLACSLGAVAASIFFSNASFLRLKSSNNSYRNRGNALERSS